MINAQSNKVRKNLKKKLTVLSHIFAFTAEGLMGFYSVLTLFAFFHLNPLNS